jgi:hypothetical protein
MNRRNLSMSLAGFEAATTYMTRKKVKEIKNDAKKGLFDDNRSVSIKKTTT